MGLRIAVSALLVCLWAYAQATMSVDQLAVFVRSSLKLKHPDKQVAAYVSKIKLSERLDESTIETLQGEGAGPKTLGSLRQLSAASSTLPKPQPIEPPRAPAPIPPPSAQEQKRIIEAVREYALNYSKTLPNFLCTQVTRRYFDPSGIESWQMMDVITARLSYFEQKENYQLVLVNNQVTSQSYHSLGGATSTGEFGSMLREIFEPESHAHVEWQRWATLRGRRAYVFAYRVAQPDSRWRINYQREQEIIPGYRGLVYVDRDTEMVLRVTLEAEDIPPSFPVQEARTTLDYDYAQIAGRDHLLPLRAVVRMRSGKLLTKNEGEFRLYRKFTTEANVTFETPPPLPEEQTTEQPAK